MSVTKTNDGETVSNLERFQNFFYSEDIHVVFSNETWLSNSVNNAEILHSGYTIVRNDREGRGGGVLLGIRTGLFKTVREIKVRLTTDIIFGMCNIWVIRRRNVTYFYNKKSHLDQLFHCQSFRI